MSAEGFRERHMPGAPVQIEGGPSLAQTRACRRSPILAAAWLRCRICASSDWNVARAPSSPASMSSTCACAGRKACHVLAKDARTPTRLAFIDHAAPAQRQEI